MVVVKRAARRMGKCIVKDLREMDFGTESSSRKFGGFCVRFGVLGSRGYCICWRQRIPAYPRDSSIENKGPRTATTP